MEEIVKEAATKEAMYSMQAITLNLHQKLVLVRQSIGPLERDKKGYDNDYVSGSQILNKINHAMNAQNVLLIPQVLNQSHEVHTLPTKKGERVLFVVSGQMSYTWINADNPEEKIEVPFFYTGAQDDVSKAFGSALTYAERYFLIKFFNLPTENNYPMQQPFQQPYVLYSQYPELINVGQKKALRIALEKASERLQVKGQEIYELSKRNLLIAENIKTTELTKEQATMVIQYINNLPSMAENEARN